MQRRKSSGRLLRSLLVIVIAVNLFSCGIRQNNTRHTHVFRYFDETRQDTVRFYGYRDLDSAICHAKKADKNILVIFSCLACMDTRGKEWKTLALYENYSNLYDHFVIAWLPVDDKQPLKDSLPVDVFGEGCYVKTIGARNYAMLLDKTDAGTPPLYCFMDTNGIVYGRKTGYTTDKNEVAAFIQSGLRK